MDARKEGERGGERDERARVGKRYLQKDTGIERERDVYMEKEEERKGEAG